MNPSELIRGLIPGIDLTDLQVNQINSMLQLRVTLREEPRPKLVQITEKVERFKSMVGKGLKAWVIADKLGIPEHRVYDDAKKLGFEIERTRGANLTPSDIDKILDLLEQGMPIVKVCVAVDRSRATVDKVGSGQLSNKNLKMTDVQLERAARIREKMA